MGNVFELGNEKKIGIIFKQVKICKKKFRISENNNKTTTRYTDLNVIERNPKLSKRIYREINYM